VRRLRIADRRDGPQSASAAVHTIWFIRYTNTLSDILHLNAYVFAHLRLLWLIYLVFYIHAFYTGFSGMAEASAHVLVRVGVAGFVAFLVILFLIVVTNLITAILLIFIYRRDRGFLTEHSITISDRGLIEETEVNRTEVKWTAITRVVRTRRYILVFLSPIMAHIIPRRAFADSAECDRFYSELQSRVNTHS
jgi:hypothetical protein